jgi:hypothetical protein
MDKQRVVSNLSKKVLKTLLERVRKNSFKVLEMFATFQHTIIA